MWTESGADSIIGAQCTDEDFNCTERSSATRYPREIVVTLRRSGPNSARSGPYDAKNIAIAASRTSIS